MIVSDPGDGEPLELGVLLSLLHLGEELQDAGELLALLNGEEQLVLDSAADDVLLAGLLEQAGLEAREEDVGLTELAQELPGEDKPLDAGEPLLPPDGEDPELAGLADDPPLAPEPEGAPDTLDDEMVLAELEHDLLLPLGDGEALLPMDSEEPDAEEPALLLGCGAIAAIGLEALNGLAAPALRATCAATPSRSSRPRFFFDAIRSSLFDFSSAAAFNLSVSRQPPRASGSSR